ncbi:hypothetical protein BCR33DRAFT_721622 [Rhizoclosmatium globosum]|uniref:DNA helicase Pif1-like 2B domain-containing protein n=1 Tax=Rhizoclosmatium globosum TaxID=329046 RepID=A0A1Y2BRA1_9FUNG|nr:hypothetical protein BCR33DRAFT_721622 [Rhizoclosmatium globosum]|eukprot:ORY37272.1 hypothetical protein BCR33DRAFT_721622 [Rhizoclosmatium globosum]
MGQVTKETEEILSSLSRPLKPQGTLVPTELFAMRNEVDACNQRHLAQLPGQVKIFNALRNTVSDPRLHERLDKDCNAVDSLHLKVNAQVMCIKNLTDQGLVNGSLGCVIGFEEDTGLPVVDFKSGNGGNVSIRRTVNMEQWKLESGRDVVTKEQV